MTFRNKVCVNSAICDKMHATRMPRPVLVKSFPNLFSKSAQIFDPISYLVLRASLTLNPLTWKIG